MEKDLQEKNEARKDANALKYLNANNRGTPVELLPNDNQNTESQLKALEIMRKKGSQFCKYSIWNDDSLSKITAEVSEESLRNQH